MMISMGLAVLFLLFLAMVDGSCQKFVRQPSAVGCYKCHSINGSDVHCEDPFHPAFNMQRYFAKCEQGMDNRVGLFPARYCTKIKGTNLKTNEELFVRSCSLTSMDSMCGLFEFENVRYSGCLMSCGKDACNSAHPIHVHFLSVGHNLLGLALSTLILLSYTIHWPS